MFHLGSEHLSLWSRKRNRQDAKCWNCVVYVSANHSTPISASSKSGKYNAFLICCLAWNLLSLSMHILLPREVKWLLPELLGLLLQLLLWKKIKYIMLLIMKKTFLYCLPDAESFLVERGWFQLQSATFSAKPCSCNCVVSFFHEITLLPFHMAVIDKKNNTLFFSKSHSKPLGFFNVTHPEPLR